MFLRTPLLLFVFIILLLHVRRRALKVCEGMLGDPPVEIGRMLEAPSQEVQYITASFFVRTAAVDTCTLQWPLRLHTTLQDL